MIYNIRSRLKTVEHRKKQYTVPAFVMIYFDDAKGTWIAKEQYIKTDSKGKVIPKSGKEVLIPLDNPEDYAPPKGYTGSILFERNLG